MVDRKLLKNPNGLILGTPGSGKSFSAKREIANCFLLTADDVIICDPEAEYAPLVERLHGQVIAADVALALREPDFVPAALRADHLNLCAIGQLGDGRVLGPSAGTDI